MNTLKTLQSLAKQSPYVTKTKLTNCTYKSGALRITEKRLWIYFEGDKNPILTKSDWLTGNDQTDLASIFRIHLSI